MGLFNVAIPVLGGIGGGVLGGPVGAIAGGAAGSLLANSLFGQDQPEIYYEQPQQFSPVRTTSGINYGQPQQQRAQINPAQLNLIAQQRSIQPNASVPTGLAQQLGVF